MMTSVAFGASPPQVARAPRPIEPAGAQGHPGRAVVKLHTTTRARPSGPANIGSHKLSGAWNFGSASLYKAAMLRFSVPAHGRLAAARCARGGPSGAPKRGLALAALFSTMALSVTAHAQAPDSTTASAGKSGSIPSKTVKTGTTAKAPEAAKTAKTAKAPSRGGNKVISLDDDFLVEGKLEKPSAFYVLRRSSTDYDWARLDAVFTPLVLESVQDPLF